LNRWQNWLVWAGIFLGIGGSLIASLLYEWARPSPAHSDPPGKAEPSLDAIQQSKLSVKPLTTTAIVLVILAWVIKSGRRSA
jgi:hypothetical protein